MQLISEYCIQRLNIQSSFFHIVSQKRKIIFLPISCVEYSEIHHKHGILLVNPQSSTLTQSMVTINTTMPTCFVYYLIMFNKKLPAKSYHTTIITQIPLQQCSIDLGSLISYMKNSYVYIACKKLINVMCFVLAHHNANN